MTTNSSKHGSVRSLISLIDPYSRYLFGIALTFSIVLIGLITALHFSQQQAIQAAMSVSLNIPKTLAELNGRMRVEFVVSVLTAVCLISGVWYFLIYSLRKRAENLARAVESEEKYYQLLRLNPIPLGMVDLEGKVKFINDKFIKLFGYQLSDIPSLNEWFIVGYPDEVYRKWVKENWENDLSNALNNKTDIKPKVYTIARKDGVPLKVDVSGIIMEDSILVAFLDITDRMKAEEALRESEEKYRLFFEHAADGIFVTDHNGVLLDVNPSGCVLIGYPLADLRGKKLIDLLLPNAQEKMLYLFTRVLMGQTGPDVWKVISKNGNLIDVSLDMRALPDGRVLGIIRDISENLQAENQIHQAQQELTNLLKEADQSRMALLSMVEDHQMAEERISQLNTELEQRVQDRTSQLQASNAELEAFSYSVSHDLRAPLRAMDGYSNLLLSDYPDRLDDQGRHYLSRIQEASKRMGELIEDLLNLSRITRSEFIRRQVDLSQIAKEIAVTLRDQNRDRVVEFKIEPDLIVEGDSRLLKIVLENLMNNALKFTEKCKSALISVGKLSGGSEMVYFVKDNGIGFEMTYAGKLFAPFQRLHSVQDYPGTGIGLVIVQRIITRHGGRIWPEAEVGKGATFYFTLGGAK